MCGFPWTSIYQFSFKILSNCWNKSYSRPGNEQFPGNLLLAIFPFYRSVIFHFTGLMALNHGLSRSPARQVPEQLPSHRGPQVGAVELKGLSLKHLCKQR